MTTERCPMCGPGYHYGDDGCRHTPPSTGPDYAAVLAEHHWGDDTAQVGHHAVQCGCGWKDYEPSEDIYALRARHDQHRAAALLASDAHAAGLRRAEARALREAADAIGALIASHRHTSSESCDLDPALVAVTRLAAAKEAGL